jgi:hypothetical protein
MCKSAIRAARLSSCTPRRVPLAHGDEHVILVPVSSISGGTGEVCFIRDQWCPTSLMSGSMDVCNRRLAAFQATVQVAIVRKE